MVDAESALMINPNFSPWFRLHADLPERFLSRAHTLILSLSMTLEYHQYQFAIWGMGATQVCRIRALFLLLVPCWRLTDRPVQKSFPCRAERAKIVRWTWNVHPTFVPLESAESARVAWGTIANETSTVSTIGAIHNPTNVILLSKKSKLSTRVFEIH